MIPWWNLIPKDLFKELRESEFPGGMAHRMRTGDFSVALSAGRSGPNGEGGAGLPVQRSEYFYWDLQSPSPVFFQEFFSRYSRTGTLGDPTKASIEKGQRFVER